MDNYEDGWLESAYEDRTHIEEDWWDDYMEDHCRVCGEHYIDCLCDFEEEGE